MPSTQTAPLGPHDLARAGDRRLAPVTTAYPTALRRGHRSFRRCDAPARTVTPLPDRRWSSRELIAGYLRYAGGQVPDPTAPDGWRKVPAIRSHGVMTAVVLYDALWWFAEVQQTGTPRTGTSTLAWQMAPAKGWERKPAAAMIDAHAKSLRTAARWLQIAGAVRRSAVEDEHLQARGTDWELLPAATFTDEELAAADEHMRRYASRHPDLTRARPRSAKALGERLRRFKHRTRLGLSAKAYERRYDQSAPLPSGKEPAQQDVYVDDSSSDRARARPGNEEGETRLSASAAPAPAPRATSAAGAISEEDGATISGARGRAERLRDGRIVHAILAEMPGLESWQLAASPRSQRRLGAIARRLIADGGDLAAAAQLVADVMIGDRCSLPEAIATVRVRRTWRPGGPANHRACTAYSNHRRTPAPSGPWPDWIVTTPWGTPAAHEPADGSAPAVRLRWLPDLSDREARAAIHRAAAAAGVDEAGRLARAIALCVQAERGGRPLTEDERCRLFSRAAGSGWVRVVTQGAAAAALVPPPWAPASSAVVRTVADRAPTEEQRRLVAWAAKRAGVTEPREASTFTEAWQTIADLLAVVDQRRSGSER